MARFKLLGGTHIEGKKVYQQGEVVESDKDLTKTFVGKFERLSPEPSATPTVHLPPDERPRSRKDSTPESKNYDHDGEAHDKRGALPMGEGAAPGAAPAATADEDDSADEDDEAKDANADSDDDEDSEEKGSEKKEKTGAKTHSRRSSGRTARSHRH